MKDLVLLLDFFIPGPEEERLLFLFLVGKTKRAVHESHGAAQTWPCKSISSPGEVG